MSTKNHKVHALEINADMVGAIFTDQSTDQLRIFCFFLNGDTGQFDVPEEENRDSLHSLFAKLDMVGQCTSVIQQKVVRGRIYVEHEGNLHSYTLLAAPGTMLPSLNPEIYNLPWRTVWTSQEVDVLRLPGRDRSGDCYAVRSPVKDEESAALYRSSNAFVNPLSISPKFSIPHNWVRYAAAAGLLVVALGLGWSLGYRAGCGTGATRVATREPKHLIAIAAETKAQMLANQTITGPYTMQELARMSKDGKIPAEAMFRFAESIDWVPLQDMPWASAPTASTRSTGSRP